ncbi:MAG: trypsin-like peptidase domain-containing protein [Hyphomicrobiales bacterium]|nr:trypsin-like peptidase domain-containing protein [Hyphomicrobiales bacterium]
MKTAFLTPILALALAASSTASAAGWKFKSEADLAAAVMPSFVNIYNRHVAKKAEAQPNGDAATAVEDDVGSGVVVSPDGLIVTNRHVIQDAYALFVTLSDGRRLPAKLVLAGTNYDLALIKVDPGPTPLQPARLGDNDKMRVGDRVVAIGNPLGFAGSVSSGIISAFHRQIGLSAYDDLIQTDATINKGNSGGPLFNMDGEVIGINQAIFTQNQGGSIGIGFSIPIDDVKHAEESLGKYGKVRVGWLGVSIQPVSEPMAESLGLGVNSGYGAIVGATKPDSPAARAGLRLGDIVRTFNGDKLRDAVALNRKVAHAAGQTVKLGVWREGKMIEVPVSIVDYPGNIWITKMADPPKSDNPGDFGAELADRPGLDGVEVTNVVKDSIAWYAGERAGDIIRKVRLTDVHNIADLTREVEKLKASGAAGGVIFVDGPNGPRWLDIDLLQ